ncbi:5'-deoxynucleotidase [soil metagenome]
MSHFFAYLARMKFIQRWGLMRNTDPENIMEHSLQVAQVAHALAVINNRYRGGCVSPERTATLALYHDASEVITGDLATPIKYFNPQIKTAYREIEVVAKSKLLAMLPDALKGEYAALLTPDGEDQEAWALVRAADKICAYLKCLEEQRAGNGEFAQAEKAIKAELDRTATPEVRFFLERFVPSFSLTLDELN